MAKTKDIAHKIKLIFGSHPQAKEFFFTADGQAFREQSHAANHGKTLEDKSVTKITRAQANAGNLELNKEPVAAATATTENGAKNDFQAKGAKGSSSNIGDDAREELARKYEMLSGKKAGNMKAETLTQKVAELEAAAAQGASGEGGKEPQEGKENKGADSGADGTGEGSDKTDKSE